MEYNYNFKVIGVLVEFVNGFQQKYLKTEEKKGSLQDDLQGVCLIWVQSTYYECLDNM